MSNYTDPTAWAEEYNTKTRSAHSELRRRIMGEVRVLLEEMAARSPRRRIELSVGMGSHSFMVDDTMIEYFYERRSGRVDTSRLQLGYFYTSSKFKEIHSIHNLLNDCLDKLDGNLSYADLLDGYLIEPTEPSKQYR